MQIIPRTDVFRLDRAESLDEHWQDRIHLALSLELLTIIDVLTADGEMRILHSPKKKNINHLTLYDCVSPEVQNSINETGRVTNFF